jgi:hypothetical protein
MSLLNNTTHDADHHASSALITLPQRHRGLVSAVLVLLALLWGNTVVPVARADEFPPARVGRVGFIEGDVSFYADRSEGWRKARLNFPVTGRNSVWSNGPSRAEVRIGASAVRIDADTILDFTTVDDTRTELFLQRGTLNVRLRSYAGNEGYRDGFRVATNEAPFVLQTNGRYRVDASQDRNETRLAVFVGQARLETSGAQLTVEAGKAIIVRIQNGTASYSVENAFENSFDRWAETRDQRWDDTHRRYASSQLVSPFMTGYEDLDAYGDWIEDREYGRIWSPRVVVSGWVPYRYGSWSYVRPWGWTWVDDAAWGFAPFHYGRWVQLRTRWYWWPGAYHARPVYAPALVGWYGRNNWGVSVSVGTPVGWFPLAPREHYVPAYSNNQTYIRNVNNITTNNITIINPPPRYANQGPGSTVVNNAVVVNGEPVWPTASIGAGGARMVKPALDPHAMARWNTSPTPPLAAPVSPALPPTVTAVSRPSVQGEAPRSQMNGRAAPIVNPPSYSLGSSVVGEAPQPSRGVVTTYRESFPPHAQPKPAAITSAPPSVPAAPPAPTFVPIPAPAQAPNDPAPVFRSQKPNIAITPSQNLPYTVESAPAPVVRSQKPNPVITPSQNLPYAVQPAPVTAPARNEGAAAVPVPREPREREGHPRGPRIERPERSENNAAVRVEPRAGLAKPQVERAPQHSNNEPHVIGTRSGQPVRE